MEPRHGHGPERAAPAVRPRADDPDGRLGARHLPCGEPDAPRVVVGDISFPNGGPMEACLNENGLDVDIYYPRRDGT